ncbi:DUF6461 domain-containing protein [Nonomuraea turcica]|uniref:DUF6461 domain-containing protein n=1 Tax=Nonomuraea sp. G32 TaxID=3067274 RepID=UPI00273BF524|nr:DUF6461 domain-containing protein [Nonomuraea sp. G32]MDP4511099.1 DUF6461 domain-containing protein [Nonomuraea sp. G32]
MQSPTYLHELLVSTFVTEGLDHDPDLWSLGFSTIGIKGADLGVLAQAFSLDLTTRTPCHLSEILDHHIHDGFLWVAEAGGWIGIMPARSDDAFLLLLTEGGRQALTLSMNISGHDHFKYAQDGRMVASFIRLRPDPMHGDDPHALDHLMDGLRFQISGDDVFENRVEENESISSALALIGRSTETDIATDCFQGAALAHRHQHYLTVRTWACGSVQVVDAVVAIQRDALQCCRTYPTWSRVGRRLGRVSKGSLRACGVAVIDKRRGLR